MPPPWLNRFRASYFSGGKIVKQIVGAKPITAEDVSDPLMGGILRAVIGAFAEMDRLKIVANTSRGKREKVAQGRPLEPNGIWHFAYDDLWNVNHGNMPAQADLTAGRRTNAMVGAVAVGIVYLLGRRLHSPAGGSRGAAVSP